MAKLNKADSLAKLMKMRDRRLFAKAELEAIAERHGLPVSLIMKGRRTKQAVAARLEFIKWARRLQMGSMTIGRMLGGMHHSTVLYHSEGWRPAKFARYQAKRAAEAANV